MRVSAQKLKSTTEKEILRTLFLVFTDANKISEIETLFRGLLTKAELVSVAKRIAAARYLEQGFSYGEIKKLLKISSATVSQIQMLARSDPGFEIALNKIRTEEWASKWEKKIKTLFNK